MSDLHAFDANACGDRRPSYFDVSQTEAAGDNPVQDLKEFIAAHPAIKADYLVFCGDLADQAYPAATERAWKELQEISALLKAKQILPAAGNHDLDSRHSYNDYDAKGCLLELVPGFPLRTEVENNHYWTHHFAVLEPRGTSLRLILMNSSAYHGEVKEGARNEFTHGRVSKRTRQKLLSTLQGRPRKEANVVIIHHHPQKQSELKLGDYDDMHGGYEFLQALDPVSFGPWLVIHGHKHFPKISYAQGGGGTTPVIFSAGSCAAIPYPEIASRVGQQVYLITLEAQGRIGTSCYGTFKTWDWAPGRSWDVAQIRSGLPAEGGFGFRGDLGAVGERIAKKFPKGGDWRKVEVQFEDLRFLLPSDQDSLVRVLSEQFGYSFEISREGRPILFKR